MCGRRGVARSGATGAGWPARLGAGLALGLVRYMVAPLGLSSAATNPWLPGSSVDPLVLLAWLLLLGAPAVAAVVAVVADLPRVDRLTPRGSVPGSAR
jgi:hypothetical protein